MKILLLDIETCPNTAYVWGIWQENIPLARLIDTSEVLCWSAKWLGAEDIMFDSKYKSGRAKMLKRIHKLLDDADAVVTYNGDRFDIPVLNKEFLLRKLGPPAPYKSIDVFKTVKSKFRFVSNKLDFISQQLGLGKKKETEFKLWVDCMENNPEAWAKMEEYNRGDVELLESNYLRILPWIKGHANWSTYTGELVCPSCGGSHYQRRGYRYTMAGKYAKFQCQDCGGWFRSNKSEAAKEKFLDV